MQQLKDGKKTSTMFLSIAAMLLSTLMPFILSAFDEYVKTLPPNSWVAILAPVVVSSIYAVHRALTANNARDNEAKIEIAKLTGQAPGTATEINAGGNVTTGKSTPMDDDELPLDEIEDEEEIQAPSQ